MEWTAGAVLEAREERGWTQQQLADLIDASLRSVVAWEAGTTRPSRRYQRALEKAIRDHDAQQGSADPDSGPTLRGATNIQLAGEFVRRLAEVEQLRELVRAQGVSLPRPARGSLADPPPVNRPAETDKSAGQAGSGGW